MSYINFFKFLKSTALYYLTSFFDVSRHYESVIPLELWSPLPFWQLTVLAADRFGRIAADRFGSGCHPLTRDSAVHFEDLAGCPRSDAPDCANLGAEGVQKVFLSDRQKSWLWVQKNWRSPAPDSVWNPCDTVDVTSWCHKNSPPMSRFCDIKTDYKVIKILYIHIFES